MIWAEVFWGLIVLLLMADTRRIHIRLASLPVLCPDESDDGDTHRWVVAPGIVLDDMTRQSAAAHLQAQGLSALDVVPGSVPLATAWSYGCHIDPQAHRKDGDRPGDTAAAAFLAPSVVLDGLGTTDVAPDLATFISWAREVRRRVDGPHDLAIAPVLCAQRENPFFDPGALEVKLGGSSAPVVFGIPFATILVLLGPVVAPWMGSLALLCHVLQQALAVRKTGFRVRYPWLQGLVRFVVDVRQWLGLLRGPVVSRERVNALRPLYMEQLEAGLERFFEPVVESCPLCGGTELTRGFSLPDLYQGKPGRFQIVRCKGCQFRFQNPRLSVEGLNFYYRDFYDGIGEDALDMVFGATRALYLDRIKMVRSLGIPRRWLDVGCGHGHMFSHVRTEMSSTRLEGLDLGDGVEIAAARGWLDEAHRGLFPECANDLKGRYDLVSMCHYLEHTVDLRTELTAAHLVLEPGGHLLIEVPDPESLFARILGRWWMPWFQPQHLNFASTVHMAQLLRDAGFEPVEWHTGRAHQPNDCTLSFYNIVRTWAPKLDVPWRPPATRLQRIQHTLVWIPGLLFVGLGGLIDRLLNPIGKRLHHTSQYRVVARKR